MDKKRIVVEELHKPTRRNFPRRKYDIGDIDETWQADLVDMQEYSRQNKGYQYLLTIIDIFSKYAWVVPVKSKSAEDVSQAMESILKKKRVPKNLHVDMGKEFYNAKFKRLLKEYKIHMYSTYSNLKASICERFNRTLKNKMWKEFSMQGNYKWLDMLSNLVESYNNTKHRTIGMKPIEVTLANKSQVMKRYAIEVRLPKKLKFKINDKVRVSRVKQLFEKGYTPNWSTEIFTITKVMRTKPVVYFLKDYQDQPVAGCFYEQELLKVKYPDIYLVEKVIKRRGNNVYVKWLGFDNSHNSWINKNDL